MNISDNIGDIHREKWKDPTRPTFPARRPLAPPAQVAGALHDEAGINHLQARSKSIGAHMWYQIALDRASSQMFIDVYDIL